MAVPVGEFKAGGNLGLPPLAGRRRGGYAGGVKALGLALLCCAAASAEDKPVLGRAGAAAADSRAASVAGGERSAAGAAVAFGEKTAPGAVPVNRAFKPAPPAALTAAPVYAAAGAPPGPKAAAAEKGPEWDREGTLKAGAVGMAGALIGFMLGGPIGAAAGFLAAFFVGAALWKFGKI